MKFAILICTDHTLLDALPAGQFDAKMRDCLAHADELRQDGRLLDSQMLERAATAKRSEEHTSELQSPCNLVCRLLLEKKKKKKTKKKEIQKKNKGEYRCSTIDNDNDDQTTR